MKLTTEHNNAVLLPYNNYIGGPGTFIDQLTNNWSDSRFTKKFKMNTKIILIIVYYNPLKLLIWKYIFGLKVVLRLDGMTIPKIKFDLNVLKKIITSIVSKIIYKYISDHVVFQSEFVRNNIMEVFGTTKCQSSIIFNGVCLESATKKKKIGTPVNIAYWGTGITTSQVELLISICKELDNLNLIYKLHIIGKTNSSETSFADYPSTNLYYYGRKSREDVYKIAQKIDLFLMVTGSSSPNTLVECLALGIPVVGYSDQGNKEIIDSHSGILFMSNDDLGINVSNFINGIHEAIKTYDSLIININKNYEKNFDCNVMRENYNRIFHQLTTRN